jgi:hypothetical protein
MGCVVDRIRSCTKPLIFVASDAEVAFPVRTLLLQTSSTCLKLASAGNYQLGPMPPIRFAAIGLVGFRRRRHQHALIPRAVIQAPMPLAEQ